MSELLKDMQLVYDRVKDLEKLNKELMHNLKSLLLEAEISLLHCDDNEEKFCISEKIKLAKELLNK